MPAVKLSLRIHGVILHFPICFHGLTIYHGDIFYFTFVVDLQVLRTDCMAIGSSEFFMLSGCRARIRHQKVVIRHFLKTKIFVWLPNFQK